mmetsp:Transcript_30627/g.70690  ORF Transcript_30627/g.70690 Transcript_30627/m.70690 type:complete len:175 (+) Transcript_30627:469-993(+)
MAVSPGLEQKLAVGKAAARCGVHQGGLLGDGERVYRCACSQQQLQALHSFSASPRALCCQKEGCCTTTISLLNISALTEPSSDHVWQSQLGGSMQRMAATRFDQKLRALLLVSRDSRVKGGPSVLHRSSILAGPWFSSRPPGAVKEKQRQSLGVTSCSRFMQELVSSSAGEDGP